MQLDTAVVVPVVAACAAVVAAMWQVTKLVAKAGGMLQRLEETEKFVALIPAMAERVNRVTDDVSHLAGNLASLVEEQRKLHSDHRELKQALAVEIAVRQHSEGDFR